MCGVVGKGSGMDLEWIWEWVWEDAPVQPDASTNAQPCTHNHRSMLHAGTTHYSNVSLSVPHNPAPPARRQADPTFSAATCAYCLAASTASAPRSLAACI